MQDRYVADAGDYGKYGLLRQMCAPGRHRRRLTLGVNWYRVADPERNNDGRHVSYLEPTSAQASIRHCDRELYDELRCLMVVGRRQLAAVERSPILPDGTVFFSEALTYAGVAAKHRPSHRAAWAARAVEATRGAELVFLDPDNGFGTGSPFAVKGPKYVFTNDLVPYIDRGQSLVVYHHIGRRRTATMQVIAWLEQLGRCLPGAVDRFALRYRRGTARAYFVFGQRAHDLRLRARSFMATSWREHFEWVPPHDRPV